MRRVWKALSTKSDKTGVLFDRVVPSEEVPENIRTNRTHWMLYKTGRLCLALGITSINFNLLENWPK